LIFRRKPEHFLNELTQLCPTVKTPKNIWWHSSHQYQYDPRKMVEDIGARAAMRRLLYFFCGFWKYAKIEREKKTRERGCTHSELCCGRYFFHSVQKFYNALLSTSTFITYIQQLTRYIWLHALPAGGF
jgi:hypothetical protein